MLLDKSGHKLGFHKDTQKRKGDFWEKLLLQSSVSVEKVSCALLGTGQPGWQGGVCHSPGEGLEFWRSLLGPGLGWDWKRSVSFRTHCWKALFMWDGVL